MQFHLISDDRTCIKIRSACLKVDLPEEVFLCKTKGCDNVGILITNNTDTSYSFTI